MLACTVIYKGCDKARTDSNSCKDYSWRDVSYHSLYQVADTVLEDIQSLIWVANGKAKRRLKGDQLEKLTYSVEKLIRDSLKQEC